MKFTSLLRCPECESDLALSGASDRQEWLECNGCGRKTPVINGFALFNESNGVGDDASATTLESLEESFGPAADEFENYMNSRAERGIFEAYAALQPFNESTRSFYPFVEELRKRLTPGDRIIDASARTGWHALLLSALFPEQQVFGLWEGNTGVLGYSGFAHWLGESKRPANLEILFSDPAKPLPFENDTVDLIFAYDVLHHNEFPFYVEELLRVAKSDGVLLLSHIHLANNEPTPYFDRGGTIRHGTFYDTEINSLIEEDNRKCLILSELDLFEHRGPEALVDGKDGDHYNGFGIVADESWLQKEFAYRPNRSISSETRLLINPLQTINPFTGRISFNESGLRGKLPKYIDRHNCYKTRLARIEETQRLESDEIELLLLSEDGSRLSEYTVQLGWDISHCIEVASRLQELELVAALPVSRLAIELQDFYTNRHRLLPERFVDFWNDLLRTSPDENILELEGQPITVEESHQLISAFGSYVLGGEDRNDLSNSEEKTKLMIEMMACWWVGRAPKILGKKDKRNESTPDFWSIINEHIGSKVEQADSESADTAKDSIWYRALFISTGEIAGSLSHHA